MAITGLSIQHDANHGAFSKNPLVNRIFGFTDDIIGGSALMWRHQHVISHHTNPNHHVLDADTVSNFPIIRMNPNLPVRPWNRFQHIYGPCLYSLLGLMYPIGDIQGYLNGTYEHIPLHPLRIVDRVLFIVGKVLHYTLFFAVPIYVHGWYSGILHCIVPMQLVGGWFLAAVFAVSHNTEECEYNIDFIADKMDWAEMQIRTSANWSVGSTMWLLVSGGLNYQIEHHLFPGVAHIHYPEISKIIQDVCKENDIPYNSYPTYTDIFTAHVKMLKKLGHWKGDKSN
eukprot:TRINITY_DN1157_c0_g1_i2.p1 TRINITY_DN1157_c0_g1~~TRINITY_DN1157_c0_g1_i2.p1  ORF type:complete len:284 (+),score=34.62 TRINITY_DN1157_c0_g1_i2:274-1125(+)